MLNIVNTRHNTASYYAFLLIYVVVNVIFEQTEC